MPKRRQGQRLDPEAKQLAQGRFLLSFRELGNVKRACELAEIDRGTVYDWLERDDAFAVRYRQAESDAADEILDELRRRAVKGVEKPLVSAGRVLYEYEPEYELGPLGEARVKVDDKGHMVMRPTGKIMTVTEYSDHLLGLLANARIPGFRAAQDGGTAGGPGHVDIEAAADELDRKLARLFARAGAVEGADGPTEAHAEREGSAAL
jgi:hypothetical protein